MVRNAVAARIWNFIAVKSMDRVFVLSNNILELLQNPFGLNTGNQAKGPEGWDLVSEESGIRYKIK